MVIWISEHSTNPDVFIDTIKLIPEVEWHSDSEQFSLVLWSLLSVHNQYATQGATPSQQKIAYLAYKALFHLAFMYSYVDSVAKQVKELSKQHFPSENTNWVFLWRSNLKKERLETVYQDSY